MSEQDKNPGKEAKSTPQQAGMILKQIGEITARGGKDYGHVSAFGEAVVSTPQAIAEHFPTVEDDSMSAGRTVYLYQNMDRETGLPETTGVVANVMFIQKEKRDADLGYATNANYHVISDDGISHRLERHVTSTEFGKAAAAKVAGRFSLGSTFDRQAAQQQLSDMLALRERLDQTRPMEAAMGLHDVTAIEAQQVSDTLATFLPAE